MNKFITIFYAVILFNKCSLNKSLSLELYNSYKIDTIGLHFKETSFYTINSIEGLNSYLLTNSGKKNGINLSELDFNTFKYVLSFGRKIKEIYYDQSILKDCPYLKDYNLSPVNVKYEHVETDTIYLYRIKTKNKLAGPCG